MGILRNRPVLKRIVNGVAAEIAERTGSTLPVATREAVVDRVAARLGTDPVLTNQLNEETPVESGVTVAFGAGIATTAATFLYQWLSGSWSEELSISALGFGLLQAWGLYRRWAPDLGPLKWFGLRK